MTSRQAFTREMLDAARGLARADTVFKNATIFNPFTCDWQRGDLAVKNGIILGTGAYTGRTEHDCTDLFIIPGLIDSHVHIESSLLAPQEYARLVAPCGTTTVIADPHEIANVAGASGIEFMLAAREEAAIDIQYMLPSCVPAAPLEKGGAILDARDLGRFTGREGILGLGEMMNFPGVLAGDPGIGEKLALSELRDGHAPGLSGSDLNAYILAGLQSDHECTGLTEAEEKLRKGMYIFIRDGTTEHNIETLIPLVTPLTVSRCCFATDDCHPDLLVRQGHIDRCIRKAIACGLAPELALRMATLSAAERFGLNDRGALVPGRRADLCIIDDPEQFRIKRVFYRGAEITGSRPVPPAPFPPSVRCPVPASAAIRITGTGPARVIGLIPGQIVTESLRYEIDGRNIPDTTRDLLKVVVCNRYGSGKCGVGLAHGFAFRQGAIAASISHDTHNIVACGVTDDEIIRAISSVIQAQGGMAAVIGSSATILPLDCAGLMSTLPCDEVVSRLDLLGTVTHGMGGIDNPFMYLSFLALTVIPALRITDRGVFACAEFRDVPLFIE
jgi:adenine deaminase